MGHDEHFLQRLDRIGQEQLDLALGLYRDHELVRFILENARAAEGAERVALALASTTDPPHVVVARSGAFVTCLGAGMSTGELPVVAFAQVEALSVKHDRVREGLDLAKKRGFDETRMLARLRTAGPALAREDFEAARAMIGPAAPLLFDVFVTWVQAIEEVRPYLVVAEGMVVPRGDDAVRDMASKMFGLSHIATLIVDTASREWVRDWGRTPGLLTTSPWTLLTAQAALPFVLRAAWCAGRLGKPLVASYKHRFTNPASAMELREAGWGLVAMALRHAGLRSELLRLLKSPPLRVGVPDASIDTSYVLFAQTGAILLEREASIRDEGMDLGRKLVVVHGTDLEAGSPSRFTDPASVPDDMALTALANMWVDVHNGPRGNDVMLLALTVAAGARAEDFYHPAATLHDIPFDDTLALGESLLDMQRALVGKPKTVHVEARPGRNDPCPCGSGKKYKKCHGG